MSEVIVVFNAGSTSLKFGAYDLGAPQELKMGELKTGELKLFCAGRIDSMQGGQNLDEVARGADRAFERERSAERSLVGIHRPADEGHHIEGGADHLGVVAERDRRRHRHLSTGQGAQDAELP